MAIQVSTPWHTASYERFWQERLPQLLVKRLPLLGYQVQPVGDRFYQMTVMLASPSGELQLIYPGIPRPDADGVFEIDGEPRVVVPTAANEELDTAEIECVGEQLFAVIQERLGQAPADLPWDESLAQAWLPLAAWVDNFLREKSQRLDTTNWISRSTHLRRLLLLNKDKVIASSQMGRVCPFETPEGPNIGRVFTIALGAVIRDGRLVVVDKRPEAALGISASMLPFLENNDPNRLLMAVNLLRQAIPPRQPEPAWVQTGNEPDAPGFWCGRNLLTAFISWGEGASEDGIILSESAARRMDDPFPVEPGDKLANRHGSKGVVSLILPDDQMPHLADGTPVELVYNFIGLRTRMHIGQVREAVLSRIARRDGVPAVVPPFHAPPAEELIRLLNQNGLPATGMETLIQGKHGSALQRSSTVGWVYWNRLAQIAREKLQVSTNGDQGQVVGERECAVLREAGAYQFLQELLNTRSTRGRDAARLDRLIAEGTFAPAASPTPMFNELVERLRIAGIRAIFEGGQVSFSFAPPEGDVLELARPVPYPWQHERSIACVGKITNDRGHVLRDPPINTAFLPWEKVDRIGESLSAAYDHLVEANSRLKRMLTSQAPERMQKEAAVRLETKLNAFFDTLLPSSALHFYEGQLFSGRAVAAPAVGLDLDQVGMPEEVCWRFFGPFVEYELKGNEPVSPENPAAVQKLDQVMARSWIIIHRAPALTPTSMIAFHPVRDPGKVVRLNPLVCDWLNADFDGDQVAFYLPITPGAQKEAGDLLSVAGRLSSHPALIETLLPSPEVLWGLGYHSLTPEGRLEIAQIAGLDGEAVQEILTQVKLGNLLKRILKRDGVQAALQKLERLAACGYAAARISGSSLSPFIGASLERPAKPLTDDPNLWAGYSEELVEKIMSLQDYQNPDMGPQLLDAAVRNRGRMALPTIIGTRGVVTDAAGKPFIVQNAYADGLTPEEMNACVAGARRGLARLAAQTEQLSEGPSEHFDLFSLHVLARARRSKRPGVVFARAAANQEVDPLVDLESRLLVGIPVIGEK